MYIFKFIRNFFRNLKYAHVFKKAIQEDELVKKLSVMMGTQFRVDWIGRIYAVLNPMIEDGQYKPERIFEYVEDGISTKESLTKWVMERMQLVREFIHNNELFDVATFDIKRLNENDDYLFVIKPITLDPVLNNIKSVIIETALIATIITLIYIFI